MIELNNITVSYGDLKVIDDISLTFEDNKVTCIIGRSGAGKTTLLNVIADTIQYDGTKRNDGEIAYIFQNERLIPTLTAKQNVEYVLGNLPKAERAKLAEEMLEAVNLKEFMNNYPHTLSGGMQQRVSMARAFAYKSDVLLVDEPFKGLDIVLTEKLTSLMSEMLDKSPKTVVYVTHNIGEALLVADRIIVLSSAPAKVAYDVKVETDKKSRTLASGDLFTIRNKIYEILKENSGV